MVLRNRKTLRNRNRNRNRNRKTLRKRKTLRNRHKTRGGNTTDPLHTTNDTIAGAPTTPTTYVTIPGVGSIRASELNDHMEHQSQER